MSGKIKDTDYLFLSAFLRAKETRMLADRDLDRMLESKSIDDACKVLTEHGYGEMTVSNSAELEKYLSEKRAAVMQELYSLAPDKSIVDIFRIRYDYHNAKVLIKAEAADTDGKPLLSEAGRIRSEKMTEIFLSEHYSALPDVLGKAFAQARAVMGRDRDPQLADVILDRAFYEEFGLLAKASGSEFLAKYAALSVDVANLKTAVRLARRHGGMADMMRLLLPGGTASVERISHGALDGGLAEVFTAGAVHGAALLGDRVAEGESFSSFEKACDAILNDVLSSTMMDAFSEKVLIHYICAVEDELSTIRILLTGMLAGLNPDVIRERLRGSNV